MKVCLKKAEERAKGSKRQRMQRFERYLLDNWDGIKESEEIESLGAIEGQIFHHIARRMKRGGAS